MLTTYYDVQKNGTKILDCREIGDELSSINYGEGEYV